MNTPAAGSERGATPGEGAVRITHDKPSFCKYMTDHVAVSVLDTLKVRWSSPTLFNDPFDLQTEIRFGFTTPEFMGALAAEVERLAFSAEEPKGDARNVIFLMIKALWMRREKLPRAEVSRTLKAPFETGGREIGRRLKAWNEEWRTYVTTLRLFSVAEEHDDLLMWAHYADRHTGAVLRLKCIPELDTALCAALPVIYADTLPVLGELDQWVRQMAGLTRQEPGRDLFVRFVCTKSRHWSYEKEWRVLSAEKPDDGPGYVMLKLCPQEIDTIYLGCRMNPEARQAILDRIRGDLSHVRVFEAIRSDTRFALDFTRIV
ncbi:MAG: DUF2971 domain-containing protein [Nitrospiraceae bacterium]